MPFCASCGAAVEGRYCAKCGAAVDGGAPKAEPVPVLSVEGLSANTAAALTYLLGLITGILFLVLEPYNKNKPNGKLLNVNPSDKKVAEVISD